MFRVLLLTSVFILKVEFHSEEQFKESRGSSSRIRKPSNESSLVNIKITHLSVEIGRPLHIKYLKKNEHLKIQAGMTLTVRCRVTGKPEPSVLWLKNSRQMTANGYDQIFSNQRNEAILHFRSISPEDSSNYSCKASNSNGFINKWIQIKVFNNDRFSRDAQDMVEKLNNKPCMDRSHCQFHDCKIFEDMIYCQMQCETSFLTSLQLSRMSCPSMENSLKNYCFQKYLIIFGLMVLIIFAAVALCFVWYRFSHQVLKDKIPLSKRNKRYWKIVSYKNIKNMEKVSSFQNQSEIIKQDINSDEFMNNEQRKNNKS